MCFVSKSLCPTLAPLDGALGNVVNIIPAKPLTTPKALLSC